MGREDKESDNKVDNLNDYYNNAQVYMTTSVFNKYYPLKCLLKGHCNNSNTHNIDAPVVPIVFAKVFTTAATKNESPSEMVRVLLDSGSTECMVNGDLAANMPKVPLKCPRTFNTGNGTITITEAVDVTFTLPEMYRDRKVTVRCNIMPKPIEYALLVGTDLLRDLKMQLDFDSNTVQWEDASIPFKPIHARVENINEHFHIVESVATTEMSD